MLELLLFASVIVHDAELYPDPDQDDSHEVSEVFFSSDWVPLIQIAVNDFEQSKSLHSCYDVGLFDYGRVRSVAFLPNDRIRVIGDIIEYGKPEGSLCSNGVSYEFDHESGEFLRKIFQR